MRLATAAWLAWLLWFLFWEGRAFWRHEYADTATWHIRAIMLLHPVAALIVLALAFVLLAHLFMEYLWAVTR